MNVLHNIVTTGKTMNIRNNKGPFTGDKLRVDWETVMTAPFFRI